MLFERFLNPERISFPDIDIDFCQRRRGEVIEYVTGKYGRENVSQIITFGTMGAKAVIRDAARALDMPYAEADKIAKLIPTTLNIISEDALKQTAELRNFRETDARIADLLQVAAHLEGFVRHASTHAAGVVISPQPLQEIVPLYKSNKDEITTQYAMDDLEKIGLLKMDFLGLTTLTIIDDCVKLIERTRGEKLDLEILPRNDEASYALLGKGLTAGIFQFESRGMTDILRRVKPEPPGGPHRFERPLPARSDSGRHDRRLHCSQEWQEASDLRPPATQGDSGRNLRCHRVPGAGDSDLQQGCGLHLGRSGRGAPRHGEEETRRDGGEQGEVPGGGKAKQRPYGQGRKLWELVEQFAGYGFNKSHSAAYALVAYQTAYLKTHYPVEFMSALLTAEIGNQDKLTRYLTECRDMGIAILPPDVNSSGLRFTPAGNSIRFGLTAIKNVGEAAIESVLAARGKLGRFDNLVQFCENVDLRLLNKRVIESLIKAGAFDSLGARRAQHTTVLDRAMELGQKRQRETSSGQHGLFMGDAGMAPPPPLELPDAPDWTEAERLAAEKEVLGFYVTGHPLEKYMHRLAAITRHDSASLEEMEHESPVTLAGILPGLRVRPSKKGDLWASGVFEDNRGSVELLVFPQSYQQLQGVLKPDTALLIKGRVRHEENQRTKVVVSEARPLEAAVNGPKPRLRIRVDLDLAGEGLAAELLDVLSAHPGSNPLILELTRAGEFSAILRLGRPRSVAADEDVINQLRGLAGVSAVELERQSRVESQE